MNNGRDLRELGEGEEKKEAGEVKFRGA